MRYGIFQTHAALKVQKRLELLLTLGEEIPGKGTYYHYRDVEMLMPVAKDLIDIEDEAHKKGRAEGYNELSWEVNPGGPR